MSILKKLFYVFLVGVIIAGTIAVAWFYWPQKTEDSYGLLPADALGYGHVGVQWTEAGAHQLFELFWQKFVQANPRADISLVKKSILVSLPQDIVFGLQYGREYAREKKKPDIYAVVPLGRRAKLLELAQHFLIPRFDKNSRFTANWNLQNDLLVYTNRSFPWPYVTAEQKEHLKSIFQKGTKNHVHLYLPNRQRKLTDFVRLLEEKNSFSFFPTIDAVEHIEVQGTLVNTDVVSGKIVFVSQNIAQVDAMALDALFLNNVLLRLLLGAGYEYEGTVNILANFVELDFTIRGLNKLWAQIL